VQVSTKPAAIKPSTFVTLASCSNPYNHPNDTELMSQYNDLDGFLSSNGVGDFVAASLTAHFGINEQDHAKASDLIRQAIEEKPDRWSRIEFNLRNSQPEN